MFPAVALIIGLFWYKRRRIDRADPGGIVESNSQDNVKTSYVKEAISNLYDPTDEKISKSFSTSSCTQQEEPTRVPRKVSESMDIPNRKSVPQSCDSSQIFTEVESTTDIQLSSNPTTSYFETIAMKRNTSSFDMKLDDNITEVFEDATEEGQCSVQSEMGSPEQNDTAAEFNCETNKQLAEEHLEDNTETAEQATYERDSANHSPTSGVLEGSIIDEARSEEGSTDSGKGGSINGCRKANAVEQTTYYFAIPQQLVGRLIGRHGSFLHNIRTKTEVQIYVNDHPGASDQKICSIEGNAEGINTALDLIRKKFPEKRFPEVTLAEIPTPEMTVEATWVAQLSQLFLVEGVNNDIIVSHIVKPNWLFIQFPTHPTFPSLRVLDLEMTCAYNATESSIPSVLTSGIVYVANWFDVWVRVCMEKPDPLGERHLMRLLDHGGYYEFSSLQIRDIRPEFLNLPFQATEIFLANIRPKDGAWLNNAYDVVARVCFGVVGQAQVEGYIDTNVYTNIYYNIPKYGVISLADELVARGFAEPANSEDIVPETSFELFEEPTYS
ncbi:KH domain-containing protein akap-1 isoform X2 [Odontomachus brunneus]|nr:KH domain-containing protein akap-1 isoform X2 [Odontomachus brunneus]XP_032674840.1 KH domain-containing protein akap-1 isoform X2 [Odontomachus brunneus]XP_032674841.1 KH domain-containing protein akap-1 isoform X2 [Odontomachus brunneus]XP_032674842.1 KH domain-containing protein akap-1 isoform X2 [Odontomachus brunneus]